MNSWTDDYWSRVTQVSIFCTVPLEQAKEHDSTAAVYVRRETETLVPQWKTFYKAPEGG